MSTADSQDKEERPSNTDIDLEHLITVLDIALSSDNPAVKDQLQKLLMISVLVSSNNPAARAAGPLKQLLSEINGLRNRVRAIESTLAQVRAERYTEFDRYKSTMAKKWENLPETKPTTEDKNNSVERIKRILGGI